MKVSDLVRKHIGIDTRHEPWKSHGLICTGLVMRIDKEYYGSGTAYKVYNSQRGQVLHSRSANGIGPTAKGIRDRVLVLWANNWTYEESLDLKVINESR
tara:strand:- start:56 stop:352 length:297 start_codon:yes stop_codon:yes gene_type:complete